MDCEPVKSGQRSTVRQLLHYHVHSGTHIFLPMWYLILIRLLTLSAIFSLPRGILVSLPTRLFLGASPHPPVWAGLTRAHALTGVAQWQQLSVWFLLDSDIYTQCSSQYLPQRSRAHRQAPRAGRGNSLTKRHRQMPCDACPSYFRRRISQWRWGGV